MLTADQIAKFREDGYLIIENFINEETIKKLKQERDSIIRTGEFFEELKNLPPEHRTEQTPGDYYLESGDKIRGFLERSSTEIKEGVDRSELVYSIIGFALHALNQVFREFTYSEGANEILKQLDFHRPIACHSMYIFKSPHIGRDWRPHQDATYLYVEPVLKLLGLWIALDDTDLENGCLEFVPGSHKDGILYKRYVRNSNKEEWDAGKRVIYVGDEPTFDDSLFVPATVKAGGLVLIDSLVFHRSRPNTSSKPRQAYSFHVYDSAVANYSKENWNRESPLTFLPFYDNNAEKEN